MTKLLQDLVETDIAVALPCLNPELNFASVLEVCKILKVLLYRDLADSGL